MNNQKKKESIRRALIKIILILTDINSFCRIKTKKNSIYLTCLWGGSRAKAIISSFASLIGMKSSSNCVDSFIIFIIVSISTVKNELGEMDRHGLKRSKPTKAETIGGY